MHEILLLSYTKFLELCSVLCKMHTHQLDGACVLHLISRKKLKKIRGIPEFNSYVNFQFHLHFHILSIY